MTYKSKKRAFVTGAGSGFGRALCVELAAQQWKIAVADIDQGRIDETVALVNAAGGEAIGVICDVTQLSELKSVADQMVSQWGGVDRVFNNAGIFGGGGLMEDISIEEWRRVIDIDLWSVIYGCKTFIPLLKKQGGGHIINTASSAGTLCAPEMAGYNTSKAAVVALSETLSAELSPYNVGVTVICPTIFKTNLAESFSGQSKAEKTFQKQLNASKVTAKDIAIDTLRSVDKNRLYVMTQADAKWGWRFKRFSPEIFQRLLSFAYRKKMWVFA